MHPLLVLADAGPLSVRAKALVFEDPASEALLRKMELLAPGNQHVLITGETGTGKELLARRLHELSGREGPFLALSCAALGKAYVAAELFGGEDPADAQGPLRSGVVEAANGGTLYLDDIADLPRDVQGRLVRVLREQRLVHRGNEPLPLDVRLVAGSSIGLGDAVESGLVRSELHALVRQRTLHLLPLTERPGDILPLARHFLESHAERLGIPQASLAQDAELVLLAHDWPGNIRELESVLHYALLVAPNGIVRASDLHALRQRSGRAGGGDPAEGALDAARLVGQVARQAYAAGEGLTFAKVEAALARAALEANAWDEEGAADVLGIPVAALQELRARHELD